MPPKFACKWIKPLNWPDKNVEKLQEKSLTQPPKSHDQSRSKSGFKRSLSQNDQSVAFVDLTIPLKKTRLSSDYPSKTKEDLLNWITPKKIADLAIHPKKVTEVRGWFEECKRISSKKSNPMLLVTGPCGSGKLTTVKVIATEFGYDTFEYAIPLDYELNAYVKEGRPEYTIKESQVENLIKFLRETTRFGTIFNDSNSQKLMIVKEFPNIFLDSPQFFEDVLKEYSTYGRAPLVFITNDYHGRHVQANYQLFSDEILLKYSIGQISFNSIANTQMKKVLKQLAFKMSESSYNALYKAPSGEVIDSVMVSSQGDLRNAIINLLFTCQKEDVSTIHKAELKKVQRSTQKATSKGTDDYITMMHLMGKIFNPKYETDKEGIQKLTNNPEILTGMFSTQAATSVKMIYANYLCRFNDMSDISVVSDIFSACDVLMSEWRDDIFTQKYALNLSVRGAMVTNSKPARGRTTVKGYKNLFAKSDKLKQSKPDPNFSKSVYASDCSTYCDIIYKGAVAMIVDIDMFDDEDEYHFE